eukprot:419410_1
MAGRDDQLLADESAFDDPAVVQYAQGLSEHSGDYNPFDSSADIATAVAVDPSDSVNERAARRSLDAREKDLSRREDVLRMRERALEEKLVPAMCLSRFSMMTSFSTNILPAKNWPCVRYAVLYHDIDDEIPYEKRADVRNAYRLWRLTVLCLFYNWISITAYWWTASAECESCATQFLFSMLYFFAGSYFSWHIWYKKFYNACRSSGTIKWMLFFVNFVAHTIFCWLMLFGIPGWASAGLIVMVDLFAKGQDSLGIMFFLGSIIWGLCAGFSVYMLRQANSVYHSSGAATQTREDAVRAERAVSMADVVLQGQKDGESDSRRVR